MFKSFVLGLYASGHSLHVRVTQLFAVNNIVYSLGMRANIVHADRRAEAMVALTI